jgi:hypothetical protein
MQTKDFIDPEEAIAFCKTLQDDNCIDVLKTADGTFRVNWVPNQMYTALDGKEYVDEVWTMQDGTMIVCQDLEVGHAKNIIRMMLRNERERRRVEQEVMDSLTQAMQQAGPVADDGEGDDLPQWMTEPPASNLVYH